MFEELRINDHHQCQNDETARHNKRRIRRGENQNDKGCDGSMEAFKTYTWLELD